MDQDEQIAFLKKMGFSGGCIRAAQGLKNDPVNKGRSKVDNKVPVSDLLYVNKLMNPSQNKPSSEKAD